MQLKLKLTVAKYVFTLGVLAMLINPFAPMVTYAITSGPSQPESTGFSQASADDLVDPFTGDFSYNIPLLSLPGPNGSYPFNLSYASGITVEQEASWVGLGWSLNPGAINRNLRGLPDDFHGGLGDEMRTTQKIKPNYTLGFLVNANYEVFGLDADKLGITINNGLGFYYNSYKGYGLNFSKGVNFTIANTAGLSIGLTSDSQDGATVTGGLSLSAKSDENSIATNSLTLGFGYNSKRGMTDLSLGMTQNHSWGPISHDFVSYNVSFLPAVTALPPTQQEEYEGFNISMMIRGGVEIFGNTITGSLTGHYTQQKLKREYVETPTYGYLNYEDAGPTDLMDMNRDRDGVVRVESPGLPIPIATYDVYSFSGQGTGGIFRPYRSRSGRYRDPYKISEFNGGGLGLEIGGSGYVKLGGNLDMNKSTVESGDWPGQSTEYDFGNDNTTAQPIDYEKYYYKVSGDMSSEPVGYYDYIDGDELAVVKNGQLNGEARGTSRYDVTSGSNDIRKPRSTVVSSYTNAEILDHDGNVLLHDFEVSYLEGPPASTVATLKAQEEPDEPVLFDRDKVLDSDYSIAHHVGGYSVLESSGSRYVYGLPVYNIKSVDEVFSVEEPTASRRDRVGIPTGSSYHDQNELSEKYLKKNEMSPYTTAHLLTSILGSDYVDVNDNGPDDKDLGYWVRFDYVKAHDNYQWRAPFDSANFLKGNNSIISDNKASYMYGQKEVYYLAKAETRTHVAVFLMSERTDALGPYDMHQNTGNIKDTYNRMYKLDKIKLYDKVSYQNETTSTPLQVVNFAYAADADALCANTPNTVNSYGTKLTLKEVWTEYQNSSKGAENKYVFNYDNNPDYDHRKQDRWGYYKTGSLCDDTLVRDMPYDVQFSENYGAYRPTIDQEKSAWSLTQIKTPSGSTIDIEYEADDYGYVQHMPATQMFKIVNTGQGIAEGLPMVTNATNDHARPLYGSGYTNDFEDRAIYFQLEQPINESLDEPDKVALVGKYFEGLPDGGDGAKQLFYKIEVDIHKASDVGYKELISGYARVKYWGVYPTTSGVHKYGWVVLENTRINGNGQNYHPFSIAAWQYLRSALPQLESVSGHIPGEAGTNDSERTAQMKSLLAAFDGIVDLFRSFFVTCKTKGFGSRLHCGNSVIKLCSPDKSKIGGGIRTKSVTITSEGIETGDDDMIYGFHYSYKNEDGTSSGVASYEPTIGGDENALRKADIYTASKPLRIGTGQNLYFEYPINEQYYPAASVGYQRVVVTTDAINKKVSGSLGISGFNDDYGTGGATVHEFYTAKDFPVLTDMSKPLDKVGPRKVLIPIPFIGTIAGTYLSVFQGYQVELNDMHGKPKKVSSYAVDNIGDLVDPPVSFTMYNYLKEPMVLDNVNCYKLQSIVPTLLDDAEIETRELGVDRELYVDARKNFTHSSNLGFNVNSDVLPPWGITITTIIPNGGDEEIDISTLVTNKMISRTGIVSSVESSNGLSHVKARSKLYDALTGSPLLTEVQNNYDLPVYSYSMPAYWSYQGMGPAYLNQGMALQRELASDITSTSGVVTIETSDLTSALTSTEVGHFVSGDMVMLTYYTDQGVLSERFMGYITRIDAMASTPYIELQVFDDEGAIKADGTWSSGGSLALKVVRSGRKNLLGATTSQITALTNPVFNRDRSGFCTLNGVPPDFSAEPKYSDCALETFRMFDHIVSQGLYSQLVTGDLNTAEDPLLQFDICMEDEELSTTTACTTKTIIIPKIEYFLIDYYVAQYEAEELTLEEFSELINEAAYDTETRTVCTESSFNIGDCNLRFYDLDAEEFGLVPLAEVASVWDDAIPVDLGYTAPGSIDGTPDGFVTIQMEGSGIPVRCLVTVDGSCTLDKGTAIIAEMNECDGVIVHTVNNVLNASAVKYSDLWPIDRGTINGDTYDDLADVSEQQYKYGSKGIWKPKESFVYHEQRKQINNGEVDLNKDGTYNVLPIFQCDQPFFLSSDCNLTEKWVKASTVSKYNAYNYQVENFNPLDIYSAALYGYNGKLNTAVANNARYYEIGFESFEEQTLSGTMNIRQNTSGNLDFVDDMTGGVERIIDKLPVELSYNTTVVVTDPQQLLSVYSSDPKYSFVLVGEAPGNSSGTIHYETRMGYGPGSDLASFQYDLGFTDQDERCWVGELYIIENATTSDEVGAVYATDEEAHTGYRSLKMTAGGIVYYPQYSLDLKNTSVLGGDSKNYVVSGWVKRDVDDAYTYDKDGTSEGALIAVKAVYTTGQPVVTIVKPIGELINGWQKIEGEFTVNEDLGHIEIGLQGGLGASIDPTYFDDIRVFPADGSFMSYVYDPVTYRMLAELDDNNYATFYSYGPDGSLQMVKKETPRGIMTIGTNMSYMKPNN